MKFTNPERGRVYSMVNDEAKAKATRDAAYRAHCERLEHAWRDGGKQQAVTPDDDDDAHQRRVRRIEDGWRGTR